MVYVKTKDPWSSGDILTVASMNNFETIHTEASSYLASHNHDSVYYTKAVMDSTFFRAGNDGPGSGLDADLIYKASGNLHASSFAGLGVPTGLIVMWYGSVASIPSGWHLCDGTSGTVDLRSDFVYGAGTVAVGTTGTGKHTPTGTVTVAGHALTVAEIQNHRHAYNDYFAGAGGSCTYTGGKYSESMSQTRVTGYSSVGKTPADEHTHSTAEGTAFIGTEFTAQPPYYALAFIQKI